MSHSYITEKQHATASVGVKEFAISLLETDSAFLRGLLCSSHSTSTCIQLLNQASGRKDYFTLGSFPPGHLQKVLTFLSSVVLQRINHHSTKRKTDTTVTVLSTWTGVCNWWFIQDVLNKWKKEENWSNHFSWPHWLHAVYLEQSKKTSTNKFTHLIGRTYGKWWGKQNNLKEY